MANLKSIALLLVLVTLISCTTKNDALKGVWIMVSTAEGTEPPMFNWGTTQVFDFTKDSLVVTELANMSSGNYGEKIQESFYYNISENNITVNWGDTTTTFEYTLNDSLILKTSDGVSRSLIFKRVDTSLKLTAVPQGSYLLCWPEDSARINFINDSVAIGFNYRGIFNWRMYSYKEANFIIYDQLLTPISGIWNTTKNNYQLRFYLKPDRTVTLNKLPKLEKSIFFGNWQRHRVVRNGYFNSSSNPPPPPPPGSNVLLAMTIDTDTITSYHYQDTIKEYWQATEAGGYIYFPNRLNHSEGVWRVDVVCNDSLVLIKKDSQKEIWYRSEE